MDYKVASQRESFGKQAVGIKISIAMGHRNLTNEEACFIDRKVDEIAKLIGKHNLLEDKEYMDTIAKEKVDILACFGSEAIHVKEIPNGYSAEDVNPWFIVTTNVGPIKIGWRKRVIEIDWSDSAVEDKPNDLFPDEDVTKGDDYHSSRKYIHAWGYEKATEYINKLLTWVKTPY